MFEIEWTGDPGDPVNRFLRAAQWFMRAVSQELWGAIMEESPVRRGRLAGSWQLRQIGPLEWAVGTDVRYAAAVQEGTSPHDIVAVRAKALAFEWYGRTVFFKRVRHPGTDPNPYIDRAIARVEERLDDFAAQALDMVGL